MLSLSVSAATASVVALRRVLLAEYTFTSTELRNGKGDRSEKSARIFIIRCGNTFLFGNAVIGGLNKDLRRTNDTNDRKNAKRNVYTRTRRIVHQGSIQLYADRIGDLGNQSRALLAGWRAIALYASSKHDRLNGFDDSNRGVAAHGINVRYVASVVFGSLF